MIALSVGIILVLILMGMSVPWCFLCGSLIYVITTGSSTGSFVSTAFYSLESTSTLAIPLFMAAGVLLEKSGIARTLIDLAEKLVGKLKGGMGATIPVVACFFGALSGSGTATVTTLSSMMAPRLRELGWDKRYLAAFIAACGPLGYMIPPNMNAILYANVSSASISGLFLATVIPGLIWAGLYLVINRVTYTKWYDPAKMGHRDPATDTIIPLTEAELAALQKSEKWSKVLKSAIPAFLMPVIIMGGHLRRYLQRHRGRRRGLPVRRHCGRVCLPYAEGQRGLQRLCRHGLLSGLLPDHVPHDADFLPHHGDERRARYDYQHDYRRIRQPLCDSFHS